MKDIKRAFQTPPKGGNEKGVPTTNPMSPNPLPGRTESPFGFYSGGGGTPIKDRRKADEAARLSDEDRYAAMRLEWDKPPMPTTGPAAQTILRDSFEAGESLARNNQLHSARADQPEVRNFARGGMPAGKEGAGLYQHEDRGTDGLGRDVSIPSPVNQGVEPTPKPVLRPDTSSGYRSDGKPATTMK